LDLDLNFCLYLQDFQEWTRGDLNP
jgi:hypothetical protein